jgi:hypothetical protein
MAEIDKALPNVVKQPTEIPTPDVTGEDAEVNLVEDQVTTDVEQTELPDGGVEINFDPRSKLNGQQPEGHFDNLTEAVDDGFLSKLGSEMQANYTDYRNSRKDWEQTYIKGLDLLGFKYSVKTEPFQGASGATHPVLAEAVTQFQAQAYKELLPADGPVRTQVIGRSDPQREQQSQRVKDFMNYEIMYDLKEYEAEFDQMLFHLPLAGSTFKKVYYDSLLQRAVSKFVQADDLVVPYSATSLDDTEAIIHVVKMSENELRKQQVSGFYRDVELTKPAITSDKVEEKQKSLAGTTKVGRQEDVYTLLECHVNLDIEGFEDVGPEGEPTGIKLPYVVTLEESSRVVFCIRRNFAPNDPTRKKVQYFVHFKFLPGLGFYGFGLIHMIGGLSRTATVALRQLLDAGTLSNLPAGFKLRGVRVRDDAAPIQPGEFRDVDAPGGSLKDAFQFLPYKEPSQTLLQLMGIVVQAGQRFASIADMQVGDGNQQAAVGTTVALLERGSRVMSAIHKRLYAALKREFDLLAKVFATYLPPVYPYDVVGGQREIKVQDFDERIDILPVADPNIFSQTQRITMAQTELQLAMSNPQMHNLYQSYRKMYEALGVKDIDRILPPPPPPQPSDPAIENIQAMSQKPFQAYRGQDHRAHITSHLYFMATNMVRNNPMVMGALEKNILEHIGLMAQEQVDIEFQQETMMLQQLQQQAQQNPQAQQQLQQIVMKIEARKAILISEMMEEFMKEEKKITSQFDHDPLLKIKSREVDLKAMENERKKEEMGARINIDKAKLVQNREITEDKLEQNEELAELRSDTSLEKQRMANRAKKESDYMKRKDVKTLKGPRS